MMVVENVTTLINPQNGNLALKIFPFEDDASFDHLQRFSYYSIILITGGGGRLTCDFSEYHFEQGSLLSFGPYQPFMISSERELTGICLNFHSDFFCIYKHHKEIACSVLFNNVYQSPVVALAKTEMASILNTLGQLSAEMKNADLAQHELLVSYLKILLIYATRIKVKQDPAADHSFSKIKKHSVIEHLKVAIEQNFKSRRSPGDYATLLNISASALARISKNYFDKTLTDLISERLVIEAKRELYLTSKPVKAIASELGFDDEYYFSRFFKTNTDISPQFFRETVGFAKAEESSTNS